MRLLGRPERYFRRPSVLVVMFFNQTQDLRAPSADRRETLHSDQHMRQLFNASPKIRGSSPKIFYPR